MALRPVPAEIKAPLAAQPRSEQKRAVLEQPRFSGVVLVVDDDAQIRNAWHALLEAWGWKCTARQTAPRPITC